MNPSIIFDNGSGYLKAGLSTDSIPSVIIPSLVGRPQYGYSQKIGNVELKPIMIGDEVLPARSLVELSFPIQEGIISNEEDLLLLWEYCTIKKMGLEDGLKDRNILVSQALTGSIYDKKKLVKYSLKKLGQNVTK